jgi:hypothetical protein
VAATIIPDTPAVKRPFAIVLVRTIHGLISAFFLTCIGLVYHAGVTGRRLPAARVAAVALVVEGAVVSANGGDCPLGGVHRRYGDERAFFELLLPKRAAKLAVPVLGGIAALGIGLVVARSIGWEGAAS